MPEIAIVEEDMRNKTELSCGMRPSRSIKPTELENVWPVQTIFFDFGYLGLLNIPEFPLSFKKFTKVKISKITRFKNVEFY